MKNHPNINIYCIGTYHKTGTIWLRSVFYKLAKRLEIPFIKRSVKNSEILALPETRCFLFNDHSLFPGVLLTRADCKVFHVIRDPRNMLLSAASYHERAPDDREKWLHTPRPGLGGKSYKEHILSLPTLEDKLFFEMRHSHRANMRLMLSWDYKQENCIETTYESLIGDVDGDGFEKSLFHLGLSKKEANLGKKIFLETHTKVRGNNFEKLESHIRTKETDWTREMPVLVAKKYLEVYGQSLIDLGYEQDHGWLDRLQVGA